METKKRKLGENEALEAILRRLHQLEERMIQQGKKNQQEGDEHVEPRPSTSKETAIEEETSSDIDGDPEALDENADPNVQAHSIVKLPEQTPDEEEGDCDYLGEDLLEVLGADPTRSAALEIQLDPALKRRWNAWIKSRIPKIEMEMLLDKYKRLEFLETPKMNGEIIATMTEGVIKRDGHYKETQDLMGSALTCLGAGISMLMKEEEEVDKLALLQRLCDAGKLLTLAHFNQLTARKACVTPTLDKKFKEILGGTSSDEWVFGKDLGERIKETKTLSKMVQEMKVQPLKKRPFTKTRPALNWQTPSAGRQATGQTGYKQNIQPRRRVIFKPRTQPNRSRSQSRDQRESLNR